VSDPEKSSDPFSQHPAHLVRRQIVDPHARQINLATGDAPGGSIRPITARHDGFSGAGFTDHAQHFSPAMSKEIPSMARSVLRRVANST